MASEKPLAGLGDRMRYMQVDALIPYARNSRTHSDTQVGQIAASMVEFGFTNPVLADDQGIVAGHGRVLAARRIYDAGKAIRLPNGQDLPRGTVPVIDCTGWTEAQRRAYVIADNQLALNAGWDIELLKVEIADLAEGGFELGLLGFDQGFLDGLLAPPGTEGLTDPDEAPAVPDEPVSVPGDVWILGRHRLVCGDSTTVEAVDAALAGVRPHRMVTDPPYGVKYRPQDRAEKAAYSGDSAKRAVGQVMNDDRSDWREAWALFTGDVAYVWHAMRTAFEVEESLRACEFQIRSQIVWRKSRPTISPANISLKTAGYSPQHECCFYAVRKGGATQWAGGRSQSTVWEIDHTKSDTGHGTQKPVEAMRRPIENNSSPGQAVYEPFSGSGTTIIACETTGRACHAIELDPRYVDVAVLRWQAFTGKVAVLEADGRTFTEMLGERCPGKVIVNADADADKPKKKARKAA
jgi:DNA modification methylase